jgi:hypothetical protein
MHLDKFIFCIFNKHRRNANLHEELIHRYGRKLRVYEKATTFQVAAGKVLHLLKYPYLRSEMFRM